MKHHAGFESRREAVALYNKTSRYRKRGLAYVPTMFGIAFTASFLNQVQQICTTHSPDLSTCNQSCCNLAT